MLIADRVGTILHVNQQLLEMFGYDADELLGRNLDCLMPTRFRPRHAELLAAYAAAPQRRAMGLAREFLGQRKDGTEFTVEIALAPIGALPETVTIATIRDVSDRRRMERELAEAEHRLQRSQRMDALGQLTGGIAHDFHNLLGVLLGWLQMIDEEDAPEGSELRERVQACIRTVRRGTTLTRNLMAFARQQPLKPAEVDLNEIVADMAEILRRTVGPAITVSIAMSEGLWPCEADPGQVQNALLNLVLNARDAMPAGGMIRIETANERLSAGAGGHHKDGVPGDYAMLTVSDTGPGMPPEVLDRAFEPFFTTKESGKGTGLGLSMVYGFARQSGGHVTIESEVGSGTSVHLCLPRKR